ncbi:MAG TPA: SDR family oxidoreductase [Candidatus Limnocylindrales bacterium]|nr:SDR family oxidoreductase [Candidatus Limnocylindrales bacterium]
MITCLVTGGAGFIGSHLVEALLKINYRVRVLDNFMTGKRQNISSILSHIQFIEGDLRDFETVRKAAEAVDFIFHLGALPSVPRSIQDPITSNEVNIQGTLHVLEAARQMRVKRVIFSSSSSVYGDSPLLPKREDAVPNPLSPYAVTKLAGEYYCKVYYKIHGLETVCLRYFNVFGPKQDPTSQYAAAIPRFINALLVNKPPLVYGDGEQSRDFTYVENVVQANILAIKAPEAPGKIFNIAYGKRITVNELIKTLNTLLGKNIQPVYESSRPGDIRHSLADISQARQILGFSPTVTLEEGLRRSIAWFVNKSESEPAVGGQ